MKKIISLLFLSLSMQSASSFATAQPVSNVQTEVAELIAHAQSHNLSAEQTLLLAKQAIDQAAHVDDFGVEVPQDNHKKMMIIAGVVVVVVVIGGIAYYYFSEKKINTAQYIAEELVRKIDEGADFGKMEDCSKGSCIDLDDEQTVYMMRTMRILQREMLVAFASLRSEEARKNFVRNNIIRIAEEQSKKPATAVELKLARMSRPTSNK